MITQRWIGRAVVGLVLASVAGAALVAWAQPATPAAAAPGARVNQEGRTLPPMPKITKPIYFNSPEADAVLSAMQIFPVNNAWNEDISKRPVLANSDKLIASIGTDAKIAFNHDMAFTIVPPDQKLVDVKLTKYASHSDKGPYPVPDNVTIEDWNGDLTTLDAVQRDTAKRGGDRHVIVLDPVNQKLYEFWEGKKTDAGWEASNEATFDLSSNNLRPDGWTSSDAAGLPIFPAAVRYDEVERGMVEHALRFTIKLSRKAYIYPATHQAGRAAAANMDVPAMGQRVRLKATADLSGLSKHALAVAKAMQKYGMIVADNGGNWRISIVPDDRIKGIEELRKFKGSDFEFVETTGPNEGPRAK